MDHKIALTEYLICIDSEDTWIIKLILQQLQSFIDKISESCSCTVCIHPFKCLIVLAVPMGKKALHMSILSWHCKAHVFFIFLEESSWQWLYGSWIYNYICNQCLTLWVRIQLRRGIRDTTLCDKVCQLRQVGGFLLGLQFPPPIKLTATI